MTFTQVPAVLLFDVMGTVVDMDASMRRDAGRILAPLGFDGDRARQLVDAAGARLQQSMDAIVDGSAAWRGHRALRAEALEQVGPELPTDVRTSLAAVVERVDPWPDSPAALQRLRAHCRVVALSNADPDELAALSARGGLRWHLMLSAQAAQSYKPDPAVYLMAAREVGVEPAEITMVAAHAWDLRAAAALGFRTAFVRRPDGDPPTADDAFDLEVDDLAALADRLG